MGVLTGYRQVSLYMDPDLYKRATHVAKMLCEPMYEFVNSALALAIEHRATPEQRKAVEILVGPATKKDSSKKKATRSKR